MFVLVDHRTMSGFYVFLDPHTGASDSLQRTPALAKFDFKAETLK